MAALETHTLAVKAEVCPNEPYAIGLRLGAEAVKTLIDPAARLEFKRWLDRNGCYVFTINGFPYGRFHGTRVKERVFQPDWGTPERLEYTKALFEIIADIAPAETGGSVSTLPGSHKTLLRGPEHEAAIRRNLLECAEFIARLSERAGRDLHLGVEPEPLGYFENTEETLKFFESLGGGEAVRRHLGVNYDTCHLAVEFDEPAASLNALTGAGVRVSKLHFSSALKLKPTPAALAKLRDFQEDVYFHQVVARLADGSLRRYADLPDALAAVEQSGDAGEEWRVHFHIPLHAEPLALFGDTRDHLLGSMDVLAANPSLCQHIEMETYTWEVLPGDLRAGSVTDQLAREYGWTLAAMRARGLA